MWAGLGAGYGLGLAHFFRYLVPLGRKQRYREMYVGGVARLPVGGSVVLNDPEGKSFILSRIGPDPEKDLLAMSDTCPHLGCKVHWEAQKKRFLCPCHMGVFDPQGKAIAGPPADLGDRGHLQRYTVRVRNGNLFVMVKDRSDVIG